ncbi:MAG TPA: NUDIX domain-containing protein [Caulobacteraceae bacterium]|nr:NUDIX domain-containing protein [Caulobacteraceae bacterium]
MARPQFGDPHPSLIYRDRPAAFGVLERDGLVALVAVEKPGYAAWLDLPGGALEPGEDAASAMIREYGEETGLVVTAGEALGEADQFFINTDGEAFNNRQTLFEARLVREAAELKIETDHTLVWLPHLDAAVRLRHDSHAWAVSLALRRRFRETLGAGNSPLTGLRVDEGQ